MRIALRRYRVVSRNEFYKLGETTCPLQSQYYEFQRTIVLLDSRNNETNNSDDNIYYYMHNHYTLLLSISQINKIKKKTMLPILDLYNKRITHMISKPQFLFIDVFFSSIKQYVTLHFPFLSFVLLLRNCYDNIILRIIYFIDDYYTVLLDIQDIKGEGE